MKLLLKYRYSIIVLTSLFMGRRAGWGEKGAGSGKAGREIQDK